ncbi:MAG: hypothetical protein E7613_02175 [Ruminococcaceae bacterium]|nr:hypothetical protein [Oscillospiraceae bacterium]
MKDLTSGNIYKNFILFAIPMVLSGMLSQAYSTIDTVIAGKFIGDTALAAVGATSPLISFMSSIFWGFGVGFAVYVARLFGAGEYIKIKNVIYTCLIISGAVLLTVSALLIIFKGPVFSLFNISQNSDTVTYFVCYMAGFVFIILSSYGVFLTNSLGIGSFPFIMSILSAILNISGNIFTVVFLGWGVFGLAISSVIAAMAVCICYVFKFRKCYKEMGVLKEKTSFDKNGFKSSARYAVPNMTQQMIMYASGMLVSPMINKMGTTATAAYTVAQKTYDINASVYQNSSKTVSNYTSQACGARKYHLLKKGIKVGAIQAVLFALPFILACFLFPKTIAGFFFDSDASLESIEYATLFMSRFLPFIVINIFANLFHSYFRGLGEKAPLMLSTLCGSITRIVLSFILIPKMGMTGMYIAWVAFWITDAIVCILFYFKSKKSYK